MKYMLIIGSILLGGCSTIGAGYKPLISSDNQKSVVYVYHRCNKESNEHYENGFNGTSFYINNKFIGYLGENSYIPLVLPLGEVDMKFYPTWNFPNYPELEIKHDIKDTKITYLTYDHVGHHTYNNKIRIRAFVRNINPELARKEIADCQLQKAAYIKAKDYGYSY